MPGGDKRGPLGGGPGTGRGLGFCFGSDRSGGRARCFGDRLRRRGRGRNFALWRGGSAVENEGLTGQLRVIKEQIESLQQKLRERDER